MIRVKSVNKRGNRIISYTCTDGNKTLDISKESLHEYIKSGAVENATSQIYNGTIIIRVKNADKLIVKDSSNLNASTINSTELIDMVNSLNKATMALENVIWKYNLDEVIGRYAVDVANGYKLGKIDRTYSSDNGRKFNGQHGKFQDSLPVVIISSNYADDIKNKLIDELTSMRVQLISVAGKAYMAYAENEFRDRGWDSEIASETKQCMRDITELALNFNIKLDSTLSKSPMCVNEVRDELRSLMDKIDKSWYSYS